MVGGHTAARRCYCKARGWMGGGRGDGQVPEMAEGCQYSQQM